MIQERPFSAPSGGAMLALFLAAPLLFGLAIFMVPHPVVIVAAILATIVDIVLLCGLFIVNPNEGKVLQLFGRYVGTVREPGLRWANPFYTQEEDLHAHPQLREQQAQGQRPRRQPHRDRRRRRLACRRYAPRPRSRSTTTRISCTCSRKSALRNLATQYRYDAHEEEPDEPAGQHAARSPSSSRARFRRGSAKAGVEVMEARISHLAYAPEIAAAMLRRQQASAVIAARQKIVEGAVGMVDMALELLKKKHVVELDNERKAAMVSNLLVVLCGEHEAHAGRERGNDLPVTRRTMNDE